MSKHLEVLDGLRGAAALSVLVFHFQELSVGLANPDGLWLRHAYLAVDFFFCLSGYVIGYAYDSRRDRMGIPGFLRARLIRLHPLVVVGLLLGLAAYVLDPFNPPEEASTAPAWMQLQEVPAWMLVACTIGGLLMIPTWGLPNRFGSYVSLNAPAWSLMWEYLASLAYALVLWRMKKPVLMSLVALAAIGLGVSAFTADSLILGFGWGQFPHAFVRTAFSFGMGLLLFRCGAKIRSNFGFLSLSVLIVALFLAPKFERFNGLYEFLVVVLVFPLIVVVGAGAQSAGIAGKICSLCGRLSYPVYILHYAFVMLFANYHWTRGIDAQTLPWVIAGASALVVAFSYGVLVLFDEPVRQWLTRMTKREARLVPAGLAADAQAP